MRRFLTIAAVLIVLVGLAVAVYLLFFNTGTITTQDGLPGDNPFGTGGDAVIPGFPDNGDMEDVPDDVVQVAPRLVKISTRPVAAGALALDATTTPVVVTASSTATTTVSEPAGVEVRYIDRETGNMYAYKTIDGSTTRITNRTIPGVQEASWLPDGSTAFVRFVGNDSASADHIETYALPADGSEGRLLARDLGAVLPTGTSTIFTFLPSSTGSIGSTGKADGSGLATLFSSPLSSLIVTGGAKGYAAHTKASVKLPGYGFSISAATGAFTKMLGPIAGLTTLMSPTGDKILYSGVTNGALQLAVIDTDTHAITGLPNQTLTEKCVWSKDDLSIYCAVPTFFPGANYPDDWYQGTVSFDDRIWRIDFTARVSTLVADLPELTDGEAIDAVSLSLDANEGTLLFQNKRDGSLWAYSL